MRSAPDKSAYAHEMRKAFSGPRIAFPDGSLNHKHDHEFTLG